MKSLKNPNLPENNVSVAIIDGRAPLKLREMFRRMEIEVILTAAHPDVYPSVAYHPDIMLHHIEDNIIVYAPNTPQQMLNNLLEKGFDLRRGQAVLDDKYPLTIPYNIARVDRYAFHNTRYTDPVIKELLRERGIELVNVNQGYSKCLTCVVDEKSIITSDKDIYKQASKKGLDVLLTEPDKAIRLEPFDMGFIGGTAGLIGKKRLAFAGDLSFHRNYQEILKFLSLKDVDVVMLNDEQLLDLGTIIPIMEF